MKLKDFLVRTIVSWCETFSPENYLNVPIIKMELTFDDEKMQFYPSYEIMQQLLPSIVNNITNTLKDVS